MQTFGRLDQIDGRVDHVDRPLSSARTRSAEPRHGSQDQRGPALPGEFNRLSLVLPSSIPSKSSSGVEGYQRSSIASSLPGAHSRLMASTVATLRPGHSGRFVGSVQQRLPGVVQLQSLPQLQPEEAIAEAARAFQPHLVHSHARHRIDVSKQIRILK